MHWRHGFGLILFTALTSSVAAQHPLVLNKLQQLNAQAPQPSDEQLRVAMAATAKAFGEANGVCVPEGIILGDIAPITGARGILQAVLGGQLRNAWTVYATYEGCSDAGTFRYMIAQKADGTLLAPLVNEGITYANPSIMRDTSGQAAMAAFHKAKSLNGGCTSDDMKMGPTRIASQSDDLGPEIYGVRYVGSWSEIWRFQTCGLSIDVPVEFKADGDGGAYTSIKGEQIAVVQQPD